MQLYFDRKIKTNRALMVAVDNAVQESVDDAAVRLETKDLVEVVVEHFVALVCLLILLSLGLLDLRGFQELHPFLSSSF